MENKERTINVLSQETINKIAAGEVIERPSSVVKELLENAIDADADAVTIEIKDGGISYIRVTDNGCGIAKDQIAKAFLPHATSKIQDSDDLLSIQSLGFRGEALSTIAAVAQVELITRTKGSLMGYSYRIEGGEEKGLEAIGAPEGTTILVRNLFYRTPVRKKFLKTPQTEGGYISELIERIALSHPEVSIRYIVNGQTKIATKGNKSLKDLIYGIYGKEIAGNLLEIHKENEYYSVEGFIGKPVIARGNRSLENYFVNGRYIKNKAITKGIEDGYQSYMMLHRYPFCVLHFTVNPEKLDVNVHPTKMELRMVQEADVYRTLFYDISNTLAGRDYIPQANFNTEKEEQKEQQSVEEKMLAMPEPFEKNRRQHEFSSLGESSSKSVYNQKPATQEEKTIITGNVKLKESSWADTFAGTLGQGQDATTTEKPVPVDAKPAAEAQPVEEAQVTAGSKDNTQSAPIFQANPLEQLGMVETEAGKHYRIVGQVFDTYWIFEYNGTMYMMDQHAAHEKVMFEQKMREFRERKMYSQYLVPQKIITLTDQQINALHQVEDCLNAFGYEINEFGGHEYAIRAIPAGLPKMDEFDFLTELLDSVQDDIRPETFNETLYLKIATMSCKAAVKGENVLSLEEADALMEQLMKLDNPYMCPHGRPTLIKFSRTDLDRKFKRIIDKD